MEEFFLDRWSYGGILGAGSTSYVFSGKLDDKNVALKWVKHKEGLQELTTVKRLDKCRGDAHLLLPYISTCGNITLEMLVGKEDVNLVAKRLKLMNGPGIVKRKNSGYTLKGSSAQSCIIAFPIMTGSLDHENMLSHSKQDIMRDMKIAISCLQSVGMYHDDLAKRNIYFLKLPKQTDYFLGDFGKMLETSDYRVEDEMKHLLALLK